MRVFLDTNVLVAAVISRGLCAELLATVVQHHVWLVSTGIRLELDRVLRQKFPEHERSVEAMLDLVESEAELIADVESSEKIGGIDPDDEPHLRNAAGTADLFVTGDRELLELGQVQNLTILSPREAWPLLRLSTKRSFE